MEMDSYSITDLRRKSAEVVAALKVGETVALTHNGTVLAHVVPVARQDVSPGVSGGAQTSSEVVDLLREQAALLRELVEQGRSRGSAPQALDASRAPTVTVSVLEAAKVVTEPQEPPAVPVVADEPRAPEEAEVTVPSPEVVEEPLPVKAPPAAVPEPVESEPTPEEVEAVFPPGPGKVRKRPTSHAEEVQERDRTGVLRRDGRWELTVAAKEAPQHLVKKLIEEAPEEERDLLAAMDPESPEVLELLRLRGEALRGAQ
jgi:antitoxin (DNA-binding transcriptional repressor) of toxin-antitoxin stability system